MRDNGVGLEKEEGRAGDELFGSYVDMKAIYNFFWRSRWVMLGVIVVSIIASQIYLLLATKKYTVSVSIAEKGAQGTPSALGEGGVLAKLLTAKGDSSSVLSLVYAVRSTAVAERVVKSMNLEGEWLQKRIDKSDYDNMDSGERFLTAVSVVQAEVQADSDKQNPGLIKVSLTDIEPRAAMKLAKQFLIELQYVMSATELIFNKRVRLFYEDRIKALDNKLLLFGSEIARLYGTNKLSYDKSTFSYESLPMDNYNSEEFKFGVSSLDFLSQVHENVREQIKGVQNPDVLSNKIEVPQQVYLTFLEDKYNMLRSLRGMLAQQYEFAQVEEKRNEQRYLVIEAPVLPKTPSVPSKLFVTVIGFLIGAFAAFWSAVFYYFLVTKRSEILTSDKGLVPIQEPALASEMD